jgi:hypothetical protein
MLNVVMLNVVILSVIMLTGVAPLNIDNYCKLDPGALW